MLVQRVNKGRSNRSSKRLIWVKSRALYQEPDTRHRSPKRVRASRLKLKRYKGVKFHLVIAKWWPSKWRKKNTIQVVCMAAATWNRRSNTTCSDQWYNKRNNRLLLTITNPRGGNAALLTTVTTLIRPNRPRFHIRTCKAAKDRIWLLRRISVDKIRALIDLEIMLKEIRMILWEVRVRASKGIMHSS